MRLLLIILSICVYTNCDIKEYKDKRAKILQNENSLMLGGNINLTDKEIEVNNCLMKYKREELDNGFNHPENYDLSRHFFYYKDKIRNSKVYKIIKDMPKGAALHIHDSGLLGPDYILNITYMDNLYVCLEPKMQFRFANKFPVRPCSVPWKLMSKARWASGDIKKFDAEIRNLFTLVVDNPDQTYPSITESWNAFMNFFNTVFPLLTYRPVWEEYFYNALKKFREDNIMYVEVRSVLPILYELDGTEYDQMVTAKSYKKTIKRFVKDYPDFTGAKLIYAPPRNVNASTVRQYLALAKLIKEEMSEHFAGFDLVGQEDKGRPLIDFVPELLQSATDMNYFFHAGETDWYGSLTDENLVDAILLGAKRIGHAYALTKHPVLLKLILDNDIGLEVNVISNSVLSLVRDTRNHPLSFFLAFDLPVVLSSDDPGAWEADLITDDFYVAFVAVASKHSDIRMLKKLALNSLRYSALDSEQKSDAIRKFNFMWIRFVTNFNCSSY